MALTTTPGTQSDPTQRTLADLVAERPGLARTFDGLGLDFCCHGNRSLADACEADGVVLDEALAALADAPAEAAAWVGGTSGALAEHIEATHHRYLHEEMPMLVALANKVRDVHGPNHGELREVADLVSRIQGDLDPHLRTEEDSVFPALHDTDTDAASPEIVATIGVLRAEHTALGEVLARLHEVTGDYAVPADGCASYASLYQRLEVLESDLHVHIHLENNVLFPAAGA